MQAMEDIARAFEWIAVGIIIAGVVATIAQVIRLKAGGAAAEALYLETRRTFARGILLSLEVFIAADLLRTVAVEPTLENVGVLGLIVVVRTILSFSLDVEIEGVLPWRKRAADEAAARRPAD